MKIDKFEDIKAWQEARILTNRIFLLTSNSRFNRDYRLKSQLQSACISIMSNIAEGFSRKTNKEFHQFLFISKGSTAEVQSMLYILLDQGYITQEIFKELLDLTDKIARMISNLIKYLKTQITR